VQKLTAPGYVFQHWRSEPTLEPASRKGAKELFFIFKDEDQRARDHGAATTLRAAPAGGAVVIDFNKAYSPPCAFTRFATRPLPCARTAWPRVEAGEKHRRASADAAGRRPGSGSQGRHRRREVREGAGCWCGAASAAASWTT
jgi:uncharacterized protein (DUF1684 family)